MERHIGEAVGWYESGWKFGDKIEYSLSAPVGHLPYLFQAKQGILLRLLGCSEMMHSALASRFQECSSPDSKQRSSLDIDQPQIGAKYEQKGTSSVINIQPEKPYSTENHFQKGMKLIQERNFSGALASFEKAEKLEPFASDIHQNKAVALYFSQDFPNALKSCNFAMSCNPQLSSLLVLYQLKGDILYAQGQLEEALESFQNSLDLNPDAFYAIHPYCQKALILAKLERYEEALDACETALRINPNQAEMRELRLKTLASLHKNPGAVD